MPLDPGEAAFLSNIGLLMTYKCQVACPHCVIGAGPHRKEEASLEDMRSWIAQAAAYRDGQIKAVCLTGGEPFYDLDKLKRTLVLAVSQGMLPTAVTNAFWAESGERALEVLQGLSELRVLSVSADAYHQAHIPFERVRNALLAAKELGLVYDVAVCTEALNDPEYLRLRSRLEQIVDPDKISTVITFPAGRALSRVKSFRYQTTTECPATACGSAATPTIFPDGRVYACIGPVIDLRTSHPLLLGNLRERPLAEMLDAAEVNPVLHLLRVWGPGRLLDLLKERGHESKLPKLFVQNGMCNLCYILMSDSELCAAMTELSRDARLQEKMAYARLYYLNETTMLDRLNLA
jgi:MoaA/NifB/PqqE/SkfB family radical SAM enzyme